MRLREIGDKLFKRNVDNNVSTSKKQYSKHTTVEQYEYHSGKGKEYFLRGRQGYPLRITIGEAYQILNLKELGYSVPKIHNSINWHHNTSISTIRTFLKNYDAGMFEDVLREIK